MRGRNRGKEKEKQKQKIKEGEVGQEGGKEEGISNTRHKKDRNTI